MRPIERVAVVGGGTAGFLAALALKLKLPQLKVCLIRSPEIGIIGVGEGSTPPFTRFIHDFLGIPLQEFIRHTQPGLKTGTRFHWGPRSHFYFPFGLYMAMKVSDLPRAVGYYLDHGNIGHATLAAARMDANRVFGFNANKSLVIDPDYAYHVENERFAGYLEARVRTAGVDIIDGNIESVQQDENGITGLQLADTRQIAAELYIDCSGFRSLLLGKTLGEPRVDYSSTLACDRAVVGGWARPPGVPMLSYTLSDTMDAGWCWRIDHPDRINRGYVYSSAFISDDAAEQELRLKNPGIGPTRIVKFTSGRFDRSWVKNVVAIGNASGFVEPLEATSLAIIASRCQLMVELLQDSGCTLRPAMGALFNQNSAAIWDAVRDFLSLHYRFNTRLSTPFWVNRQNETNMGNAQPLVDYVQQMGPSPALTAAFVAIGAVFNASGYLAILTGLRMPTRYCYQPTALELTIWQNWCRSNLHQVQSLSTVEQALSILGAGRQI
jgi:tryptophan halogenase